MSICVSQAVDFGVESFDCHECGKETPDLHEGYCEDCHGERQRLLLEHNARYDAWQAMSDSEREAAIRRSY